MSRLARRLVLTLAAFGLFLAAPASTQSVPPPPLMAGEMMTTIANGCGMIFGARALTDTSANAMALWRQYTWSGPCVNGLLHGRGTLTYRSNGTDYPAGPYDYYYGRVIGKVVTTGDFGNTSWIALDGRTAYVSHAIDPYAPHWAAEGAYDGTTIYADRLIASAWATSCIGETPQMPGCTAGNYYRIYGIWVYRVGETPRAVWCPNPKTPVGCEALWRQLAGPVITAAQTIREEVERDTPVWRQQLARLNAPREAQIAALATERREALARQQAAAAEAADKEEKAFKAKLATSNAGQLFAYADELRADGQADKARQVLRALVSRFPEHPLAANAAQQLSQMGSGPSTGSTRPSMISSPAAAASSPAPAASSASRPPSIGVNEAACTAEVNRLADVLNASQPRNAGNSIRQMETLMFVLKAMADTTDAMCPRTQAYINASAGFRQTYNDTARTCSQVSSQGACTARMH